MTSLLWWIDFSSHSLVLKPFSTLRTLRSTIILPPWYETAAQQSDWGCSSELLVFDTGSATLVAPNFALVDNVGKGKNKGWGLEKENLHAIWQQIQSNANLSSCFSDWSDGAEWISGRNLDYTSVFYNEPGTERINTTLEWRRNITTTAKNLIYWYRLQPGNDIKLYTDLR